MGIFHYPSRNLGIQNARAREIAIASIGKSDFTFYSIGWIITAGFFGIVILFILKPMAIVVGMSDVLNMMLGYLPRISRPSSSISSGPARALPIPKG